MCKTINKENKANIFVIMNKFNIRKLYIMMKMTSIIDICIIKC